MYIFNLQEIILLVKRFNQSKLSKEPFVNSLFSDSVTSYFKMFSLKYIFYLAVLLFCLSFLCNFLNLLCFKLHFVFFCLSFTYISTFIFLKMFLLLGDDKSTCSYFIGPSYLSPMN